MRALCQPAHSFVQQHPDEAIRGAEHWPSSPTLEDRQLLSKRQVLCNEVIAAAQSRPGGAEEQERDFEHRATLPEELP
jgi:hypothetical protein